MSTQLFPASTSQDCTKVAITPPNVQNLYPAGCTGILGYGVNPSQYAPLDATILHQYIPYVRRRDRSTIANLVLLHRPSLEASGGKAVCGIQLNRASDTPSGGIFTMGGVDTTAYEGH